MYTGLKGEESEALSKCRGSCKEKNWLLPNKISENLSFKTRGYKSDIDKGKTSKSSMRDSGRISFCKGLSLHRIKWSLLKPVIDVNGEHRFKRELNMFGAGSECSHAVIREIIVHKMVSYHTWWFVFSAARGKGLMDHVLFSGLLLLVCL